MRFSRLIYIAFACMALTLLGSCSATRYVPEGEYLLKKYKIKVAPQKDIPPAALLSYVRQRPNAPVLLGWRFLFSKEARESLAIFDADALESSKANIDRHLTSQGYYNNAIRDSVVLKNRKAIVHLDVQPGRQYLISSVDYVIPDSSMRSFIWADTIHSLLRNAVLSEALLEQESSRMANYLRRLGYYNFNKSHISSVADTLNKEQRAELTIYFREANREDEIALSTAPQQRFKIESIKVFPDWSAETAFLDSNYLRNMDSLRYKELTIFHTGPLKLRPRVINRVNRLIPGAYYNEQSVINTYNRFSALRLFNGVTLEFDALPATDSLFASGSVPDGALACRIRLSPSKPQGYKLHVEGSSNSSGLIGVSPALSYFHKNVFRGGEWLTLSFMGNFQFKWNNPVTSTELGTSATLSFPTFLFPLPQSWFNINTPQTDVGVSYSYQQRPEFTRNLLSSNFGYNWRGGERFYYRFHPVQLNIVRLYHVDSTFYKSLDDPFLINSYQNHFDLGSSFTFYYTTDNTPSPAKSYFYGRWTTDLSGNALSMFNKSLTRDSTGSRLLWGTAYSQYCKTEVNAVYTWKPQPAHNLAMRVYGGIGVAYGNSKAMPFEKLFYAGGANSLRAWQARAVGPGFMPLDTTFSIPNQTGDVKLEANLEYRPKLFWKLEGALFIDAGNIWTLRQDLGREAGAFRFKDFHKSIAVAGGIGIRLNLDFVLLRLDMGLALRDPHLRQWLPASHWFKPNTYAIQFGVGYPFL